MEDRLENSQNTNETSNTPELDLSEIIVVGITGRKRSGKDTLGKHLIDNYNFTRLAFADTLKEACKEVFGFTNEQVYGDDLKEVIDPYWGYTPREVLQKVGTELFRNAINQEDVLPKIGKDIWVRCVERKILKLAKEDPNKRRFVITDMRFPNELKFIMNSPFNSITIKVVRKSVMVQGNLHASEAMIDSFQCQWTIPNDESLEQFYINVDSIMRDSCIYRSANL